MFATDTECALIYIIGKGSPNNYYFDNLDSTFSIKFKENFKIVTNIFLKKFDCISIVMQECH
jgi:hypothetical protein